MWSKLTWTEHVFLFYALHPISFFWICYNSLAAAEYKKREDIRPGRSWTCRKGAVELAWPGARSLARPGWCPKKSCLWGLFSEAHEHVEKFRHEMVGLGLLAQVYYHYIYMIIRCFFMFSCTFHPLISSFWSKMFSFVSCRSISWVLYSWN